eukprot:XP_015140794.1 apelin receptor early endogenous ligand isoform X1 [Gallus gallus]
MERERLPLACDTGEASATDASVHTRTAGMRLRRLLCVVFLLLVSLLPAAAQRPANLALRRKLHRHNCSHRRCMPLHSRVPFP